MFRPEDLIQDEIEHPEQTRQLQQSYPRAQADQHSLLHIRTRLLAQRSASFPPATGIEEMPTEPLKALLNESLERPPAGQFLPPRVPHLSRPKRKAGSTWRLVALVAVLCLVVLGGTWYALAHVRTSTEHPISPHVTPTTVPGRFAFIDLKMTSTTTGWATMNDMFSGGYTIGRTTDGGKTWQNFDFQGRSAGQIGHFFFNDQAAWIIMGSSMDPHTDTPAMRTIDGGQHWIPLSLPPEMENMTFLDEQHGWAWAIGDPLAGVPATYTLYKTVDGGATWITLGTMSTTRALDDLTPGPLPFGALQNLAFLTPQRGWAVVYPSQVSGRAFLYLTQDGGKTWQLQPLPQPATGPIPGIHTTLQGNIQSGAFVLMEAPKFFTPHNGLVSIVSRVSPQSPSEIYVYATSDGGQSWLPLGTHIERASRSLVFLLDPTHLLLVDLKTITIYGLVHGQWQAQGTSHVAGVASVSFISSQRGWVDAGQRSGNQFIGTLYATSDGGKSWREIMLNVVPVPPPGG